MGQVSNTVRNMGVTISKGGQAASNGGIIGQANGMKRLMSNSASNFSQGVGTCPIVSQCRDFGQGIANGEFSKTALNASVLGLAVMSGGSTGIKSFQKSGNQILNASTMCTGNQSMKNFHSQIKTAKPLPMPDISLEQKDPEIYALIQKEKERQTSCLELIASENFTSQAVMEAMGSCLCNKYSEGYPGKRYYGGNEHIDDIEILCQDRALAAFGLDKSKWGVNVQPLSGSPANFQVYTALLKPGDRIMGLSLAHGGHLTHGHQTKTKKISASSHYYESQPYYVNEKTGLIDYDALAAQVLEFKPNMLICGASAYPADFDYERFRVIADSVGAYLMADIAHISGLVATGLMKSPFDLCDIVTSTTHKSLRGPRSGIILHKIEHTEAINFSVFPMLQGGPHNTSIAALAVQLKEVATPEFKVYSQQVITNAQALAKAMIANGGKLITNGTINHLVMWDLRPHGLTGSKVEKVLDMMHMTTNKNSIVGDKSAITPGGIRLGTPALTTRGMLEDDMVTVANFLNKAVAIALRVQQKSGKKHKNFLAALETDEEIKLVGDEVKAFANKFSIPGV